MSIEYSELGKQPISEASPAGEDVRYEPAFEELSDEIGKLASPTATSAVDWSRVIKLSSDILGTKSKNFLVWCYFSLGLMKLQKLEGLAQSIHVLKDMLDSYWDTMYPSKKKMKRRRNAIDWWKEKVEEELDSVKEVTWATDDKNTFIETFSYVDQFLGDNMDDSPMLISMINRISGLITEEAPPAPEPEPEPEPEPVKPEPQVQQERVQPPPKDSAEVKGPPPVAQPEVQPTVSEQKSAGPPKVSPAPQPVVAPKSSLPEDADTKQFLSEGLMFLGKAASQMLKQDVFNAIALKIDRIVAWLPIQSSPPHVGGKTKLPAPNSRLIASLNSMYESGNWDALLTTAESQVRTFLFWLDLHYYVAESLGNLGHTGTKKIIEQEVKGFVKRLKGIEKLSFADGTPFANETTSMWLEELANAETGGGSDSAAGGQTDSQFLEDKKMIQELVKGDNVPEAMKLLKDNVFKASSMRERFLWEIELCSVFLQARKVNLAISVGEGILRKIEDHKVDEWEPDLAAEGMLIALKGLKLQKDEQSEELVRALEKRITLLNPVKAMQLL